MSLEMDVVLLAHKFSIAISNSSFLSTQGKYSHWPPTTKSACSLPSQIPSH